MLSKARKPHDAFYSQGKSKVKHKILINYVCFAIADTCA